MLRRALAVLVLVLVAVLALRVVVGLVVGVAFAVLWIVVLVALAAAGLWAWSTLRGAGHRRRVRQESPAVPELTAAPLEDRVAAEMRRITEQLRQQGRR